MHVFAAFSTKSQLCGFKCRIPVSPWVLQIVSYDSENRKIGCDATQLAKRPIALSQQAVKQSKLGPIKSGFWAFSCTKEMTAEYEKNMANFITDVRKELGVENLPFVIANTGQNGAQTKGTFAELCQAQMNIGDGKKHPKFLGTVTSIDTRPFKATEDRSPSGFGYHWNHSGETHYKIGESMGQAMVKLLKNKSKK